MYLPRGFHVTTGEEEAGEERVGRGLDRISEWREGPAGRGQASARRGLHPRRQADQQQLSPAWEHSAGSWHSSRAAQNSAHRPLTLWPNSDYGEFQNRAGSPTPWRPKFFVRSVNSV